MVCAHVAPIGRALGGGASLACGKHRWEPPIVGVSGDEWQAHRALLERHEPFRDLVYQMLNEIGQKRWFSSAAAGGCRMYE